MSVRVRRCTRISQNRENGVKSTLGERRIERVYVADVADVAHFVDFAALADLADFVHVGDFADVVHLADVLNITSPAEAADI